MSYKEIPFILSFKRQATSSYTFTAKTEPWKSGDTVVIDAVSVSDDTSNNKDVHIGVHHGGHTIYLESFRLASNGRFYSTKNQILIPSEYQIVVKFETPGSTDVFYVNVFGRIRIHDRRDETFGIKSTRIPTDTGME